MPSVRWMHFCSSRCRSIVGPVPSRVKKPNRTEVMNDKLKQDGGADKSQVDAGTATTRKKSQQGTFWDFLVC